MNDDIEYIAVMNDEEQYSIWPQHKPLPSGWRDTGIRGQKSVCLEFIEKTWTDMRPKSLRAAMES